ASWSMSRTSLSPPSAHASTRRSSRGAPVSTTTSRCSWSATWATEEAGRQGQHLPPKTGLTATGRTDPGAGHWTGISWIGSTVCSNELAEKSVQRPDTLVHLGRRPVRRLHSEHQTAARRAKPAATVGRALLGGRGGREPVGAL